jgi:Protein kinase domain
MGFVLDVAGYGARTAPLQNEVQRRLPPLVIKTLAECGMDLDGVGHEWTGDGINAIMPADMDPTVVLPVLIRSLAVHLGADNARSIDRIRLRMAIGVGLVEHNTAGFGGPMIVDINRLVDSAPLRATLSGYPTADLAVAISDQVHDIVIRPGYPGIPGAQFSKARVVAKEFTGIAWIWVSARQWSEPAYQQLEPDDPREIGGYRVLAGLGAGQAGQVYLGSARDGSWLAIKIFRRELSGDPDIRRRLTAGLAIASALRGPRLTRVTDSGAESGRPWVASRLVLGPSLAATVTETGPLPAASAAWLALGVTRATATLHEAGLAHQAITPANVLLEPGGPVLTDFGTNRMALTDGSRVAADDVFMLGLTMFCAATGRWPWGNSPSSGVPPPQARDNPDLADCPPALLPVVTSCLAPDPAQRPAAARLLDRLTEVAGPPPWSWLPAAVAARFTDYQSFPQPSAARRTRWRYFPRWTSPR